MHRSGISLSQHNAPQADLVYTAFPLVLIIMIACAVSVVLTQYIVNVLIFLIFGRT